MAALLRRAQAAIGGLEQAIATVLGRKTPPDSHCMALIGFPNTQPPQKFSLKDLIGDGFLYAVPRHRRTIEKRMKRKYGHPEYVMKLLQPKSTLRICNVCGDDHEIGVLCPTCYKRVIDETKLMQGKIQEELKLEPVEREVIVVYEGEKGDRPEFHEGKRVVEMKKTRPEWFSKNLTQQTTQPLATTSDVKPSDLG